MNHTHIFKGNSRGRIFPHIVSEHARGGITGENESVVFRGIAYGYVRADRPHLSTIVDKAQTGSRRQKQIGYIDCYKDLNLELSIEVKDREITAENEPDELRQQFTEGVRGGNILGIALVRDVTDEALKQIEDDCVIVMTRGELLEELRRWDWPKQDSALRYLVHYLAHIEQNEETLERLLSFIREHYPKHDLVQGENLQTGGRRRNHPVP